MYKRAYQDTFSENPNLARETEKKAFDIALGLLRECETSQRNSMKKVEALHFLERLWSTLLEDLAHPDNELGDDLKARIISIGIWVIKESVAIRVNQTTSLKNLIEINEIVRSGLD